MQVITAGQGVGRFTDFIQIYIDYKDVLIRLEYTGFRLKKRFKLKNLYHDSSLQVE